MAFGKVINLAEMLPNGVSIEALDPFAVLLTNIFSF
jgi:hypothetical protein